MGLIHEGDGGALHEGEEGIGLLRPGLGFRKERIGTLRTGRAALDQPGPQGFEVGLITTS